MTPADRWTIRFEQLPATLGELEALPEARLARPQDTAALFVAAMCRYPDDPDAALEMVNWLSGPRPLNAFGRQFLRDRMANDYVPRSYLVGATPENGYSPTPPLRIEVLAQSNAFDDEGYARLHLRSGGADQPRPIVLRLKPSSGQWFLWEQLLLAGIRPPANTGADGWD